MTRSRLVAALLVALALAVHAPTLGHRFLLDDGVQIFKNPAVTRGAPLAAYFFDRDTTSSRADYNTRSYRPLRNLAFAAIVRVAGVRPLAFGLANLALYAIAALLVLALAGRMAADGRAAAWATALWIVLPVHAEPVAYASALGDLLSLACELAAIVVAMPLFLTGAAERFGGSRLGGAWLRGWRFGASMLLAAAAMLTKEMAVTEPLLLLLVAFALGAWRAPRGHRLTAANGLVAAHALVAAGYLVLRTHVVGAIGEQPLSATMLRHGLAEAPWLLVHYLWISLAPLGHAASYRVPPPNALELVLTVAGIAAAFVVTWRWRRTAALGLGWFALSLVPVLHLVPFSTDLADRFALVPTVGLALALAAAIAPVRGRVAVVALAAVIAVYAAACVIEARAWRSDSYLWRLAVDRQPDAPMARSNLAAVLLGEGRLDEAAAQLEALHAMGYTRDDLERKRAYVLYRLGRLAEAERAITAALRLDPSSGVAHALRGQLALAAGDVPTAAREHEAARRLAPTHPATGLLGYLLLRADDARVDYLRALEALAFDDAAGAAAAARACLARSPARPQCQGALGEALTLQAPLDGESRALLEGCLAALPDGPERQRCQEALWSAR